MRRLSLLALALAACATASQPELNSQKVAQPANVAAQTDGDVTTTTVNGLRILVKRTPGAEFVAGQLYVLGGVRNWTAQNAGIENLAIAVATEGGTRSLDKDAFAQRLAKLGSDLGGGSNNDFSVISAKGLKANWDETFGLMVDAFLNPALPASELEIARARQLSGLRHEQESPDGRLGYMTHMALFANHPYANRAVGTPESVAAVRADQLASYLGGLRETSRLVLVVVGDVDPMHVIDAAGKAFAGLPRGDYKPEPLPALSFAAPKLTSEFRKLPTNYVNGIFQGPSWKDPDITAGMVAMSLLNYRLFQEVRTKRNLSYAPSAGLRSQSQSPLGYLYVTAVDPNQTFGVMLEEAKKLRTAPPTAKELAGTKSLFLTGLLQANETVDGQAALLGRSLIYAGDWRFARELPAKVRAVTGPQLQQFAQGHLQHLQTFVLGDPAKLDANLFQSL